MDAYNQLKQTYGYSPNWENCSEILKSASRDAVEKMSKLRTDCRLPNLGSWGSEEDLQTIASNIGKSIILIQRYEGRTTYTLYDSLNAGTNLTDSTKTVRDIFLEHTEAIFIYFDGVNHFQAVVPR